MSNRAVFTAQMVVTKRPRERHRLKVVLQMERRQHMLDLEEPILPLVATFLATRHLWLDVPRLLAAWQDAGVMRQGVATWFDVPLEQISYDVVMDGRGLGSFESRWKNGPAELIPLAQQFALSTLDFTFNWVDTTGSMLLRLSVNEDNSVELYMDTPTSDLFYGQTKQVGEQNLHRFVDFACALFAPRVFIVGYIDVEAALGSLDGLLSGTRRVPDDWAFYGAGIAPYLERVLPSLQSQPKEVRQLPTNGLFVRWSDWGQSKWDRPKAFKEWKTAIDEAVRNFAGTELRSELSGGWS